MAIRCLTGARFNMQATLLHQDQNYVPPGDINIDDYGHWENAQDPLTGQIVRIWVPDESPNPDPNDPTPVIGTVKCLARATIGGNATTVASMENFGTNYISTEYVNMWLPPNVKISERDRITNIRDAKGHLVWANEEYTDPNDPNAIPAATIFNVNGVSPLFDPFNRHYETFVLLEKAEVQANA